MQGNNDRYRRWAGQTVMRVLIVNTNRERAPHIPIPLGACCVASAARTEGHEVRLVDLTFTHNPTSTVAEVVRSWRPDVVGLSVRNLDNCDCARPKFYLEDVRRIAFACRKAGAKRMILGGPAVTCAPKPIISYLDGDFAVVGEGETAFPALLRALECGSDTSDVSGVLSRENQDCFRPSVPISDTVSLADPSPEDWLDIEQFVRSGAAMSVQTKRGCPFNCSYCLYPSIEGVGDVRLRDPEQVASDVDRAARLGFRSVDFVDSVFNVPQQHAIACCEAIALHGSHIAIQTLELNPLGCSRELVWAMNAAGFSAVACTAESGSDAVLESLGKGYGADALQRAAQELRSLKALRMWIFMLGAPGETEATVAETARFMRESLTARDLVYVSCGVRILPGTRLHSWTVANGFVGPEEDLLQPMFYFSPHLAPARAMEIIYNSGFPTANIVTLADGNHRLIPLMQRLAYAIGASPPYWRWAPIWNSVRRPFQMGWGKGKKC